MSAAPSLLDRLTGGRGAQLARYSVVSIVSLATHQIVLLGLVLAGMPGFAANALAATAGAVPAFVLNKRWTWGDDSKARWRQEVLPFWVLTLLGLVSSTVLVGVVDARTDVTLYVSIASIMGYGLVWVAKFLVLDRLLFAPPAPAAA
ncbi:MAG: GtrA family protein [Acidimicrobiia bacterium]